MLKYERHDEMEDLKKEFNRREKAGDPAHKAMAAPIHLVREGTCGVSGSMRSRKTQIELEQPL